MSGARDLSRIELSAVSESIRAITSSLDLPDVLRRVLGPIKSLTGAEVLSLLLHDPARGELVFAATETLRERTFAGLRGDAAGGVATRIARTGQCLRWNDRAEAAAQGLGPDEVAEEAHSLLAVPLRREGRVVGALELADRRGASGFSAEDERQLAELADALAKRGDPAALAGDAVALQSLFAEIAAVVPSEEVMLVLLDPDGRERRLGTSRRIESGFVDGLRLSMDQGIAGWVARHLEAVRIDDVSADPRHYREVGKLTGFAPRTMLCVPLAMKGRLLGVIQCLNKRGGEPFTDEELQLVQTLADHAAIAIENASLYREARIASLTDDLTGLSNTRHFNETLPALLARGAPLSLIVLDLDSFKAVVDTHGHLVGSRTISQVGRRIAALLRPGDIAARFGGDEFVVILPDTAIAEADARAEAIRASIEAMQVLEGTEVDLSGVTASVGVAAHPLHASGAEALFQAADRAMYAAKAGGKNAVALCPGDAGADRTPDPAASGRG